MLTQADIKAIRALHTPHGMRKTKQFLAEGEKLVRTLLEAGVKALRLYSISEELVYAWREYGCQPIDSKGMSRITMLKTPSPVLGVFAIPTQELRPFNGGITLMLDGVQDPGNVGSIVRTANWFGVHQIVCSETTAQLFSPKGIQASMGAMCSLPVVYTNLVEVLRQRPGPLPVIATVLDGAPLGKAEIPSSGILLMGSEGRGISPEVLSFATHRVRIPSIGTPACDSLNVGAASALLCAKMVGIV